MKNRMMTILRLNMTSKGQAKSKICSRSTLRMIKVFKVPQATIQGLIARDNQSRTKPKIWLLTSNSLHREQPLNPDRHPKLISKNISIKQNFFKESSSYDVEAVKYASKRQIS